MDGQAELTEYAPGTAHDVLLLQWWARMLELGDTDSVLGPNGFTLYGFFKEFQPPTGLLFAADTDGIYFAIWFVPFMGGAIMGLWVRPDWRQARWDAYGNAGLDRAFEAVPLIMFVSKNPQVMKMAPERFGFTLLGDVPHLYGGEQVGGVGYLTRETHQWRRRQEQR